MNLRGMLIGMGAVCAVASQASALVTYDTNAVSTFELLSDGGMSISFETGPGMSSAIMLGTGVATLDTDTQTTSGGMSLGSMETFFLLPGESVTQVSEVSGSADAPGGFSEASVLNSVLVTLDNTLGTGPAVAEFLFTYEWLAEVIRDDVSLESGFASPFFHLDGFAPSGSETLAVDSGDGGGPVSVADWLVAPGAGLPFDMGPLSDFSADGDSVSVFVTVPAGSIDQFDVITDAFGGAMRLPDSAVPEPATALLGALGVGAIGAATRRRRG